MRNADLNKNMKKPRKLKEKIEKEICKYQKKTVMEKKTTINL